MVKLAISDSKLSGAIRSLRKAQSMTTFPRPLAIKLIPPTPLLLSATACGNTWGQCAVTGGAIGADAGAGAGAATGMAILPGAVVGGAVGADTGRRLSPMRKIAPALLMTALGIAMPLAVIHTQSTAILNQRDADRAVWTQVQGEVRERWAKLTDNDILEIDGRREILIGKLQTRYAISYEDAERQVGDFEARRP